MQRKRQLFYNTISSLIFQLTTIICGFILPRLILTAFGSEVNGLVNSIIQFLGIISFLELGVGAVVQSTLYKPLAEKNYKDVSKIISSANRFFSRLGIILFIYVIFLIVIFPFFVEKKFDFWYTTTLIMAISISSFAQYFFGIVNRLLLNADQRGYVQYIAQTIAVIGNAVSCFILINLGVGIQVVKLTTSTIYLLQPMVVFFYVKKNYQIDKKVKYTEEPITQKWNGVAQHVAAIVLDGTDTIVLTLFATLEDVSIYSVYYLVVNGVKQLFMSLTKGVESLMGELWAKQELKELNKFFSWFEWIIHMGTIFIFGVTSVLVIPFIEIYTRGIHDANYIQCAFAFLLVMAHAGHCLRLPYSTLIMAAGHYKQTQNNFIIAAILNVVISVLTVKRFGLIGVAIGTLVAMLYQTIWMAIYVSKNLINRPIGIFVKQILIDIITWGVGVLVTKMIVMRGESFIEWTILAVKDAVVWIVILIGINFIFYKTKMLELIHKIIVRKNKKV